MIEISQEIQSALIGAIVAFIASYLLLRWQMLEGRKLARAQLLLEFDNRLGVYDKIHSALRPNGGWEARTTNPPQDIEWYQVDGYIGAFERLEHFIESGIIDKDTAKVFYGYRVNNLVINDGIRKKLTLEKEYWHKFFNLCTLFGVRID